MKKLILFTLVLFTIQSFAQDGGYRASRLQLTSTNTYSRLSLFDSKGILYPLSNGTGYLYNNGSGGFSFQSVSSYAGWNLYYNNNLIALITSSGLGEGVDFYGTNGVNLSYYGDSQYNLTFSLDIVGLSTIVNPTSSYYLPVYGSQNSKITISTLESVLGTSTANANRVMRRDGSSDAYAHNFILSSDRRLKKNVYKLSNTEWTNKIKFHQFQFKDDPKEKIRYGVIAQEIEKIAPELVSTDEQGNKAVAYIDLLIAKVAEMDKKIKELENEIKKIKNN